MREGVLVVFHLPPKSAPKAHNQLRWRVYGRDTSSWGGKYEYHRPGLLDELPHVRLYWGVVILRPEDGPRLVATVEEEGGTALTRAVILTREDQSVLSKAPKGATRKK